MLKPIVVLATIVLLTVGGGLVSGYYNQRWAPPPDMAPAADRLVACPKAIGEWDFVEEQPLAAGVLKLLRCQGHVSRMYVNSTTGERISLLIVVGPLREISGHSPEICFPSSGYTQVRPTERQSIEGSDQGTDQFFYTSFEAPDVSGRVTHVYFAWSNGGEWKTPRSNRFEFAGSRKLYKIIVSGSFRWNDEDPQDNPCVHFLEAFLPVWDSSIGLPPGVMDLTTNPVSQDE